MENKKYRLTDEVKTYDGGRIVHRIECVTPFSNIEIGEKGGFVESESNLSQEGLAWVADDAVVFDYARVVGDAFVRDKAIVGGNAIVGDNAVVSEHACVLDCATVNGNAIVTDYAHVNGQSIIRDEATVGDCATINGFSIVKDNVEVYGHSIITGHSVVCGNATISDHAKISGTAFVTGHAFVGEYAVITGNAVINRTADYLVFKNTWSNFRHFTWTKSNNMWQNGLFYGTGEELIKRAYADSEESGMKYEAHVQLVDKLTKPCKPTLASRLKKLLN